jgi:hypothetical protein
VSDESRSVRRQSPNGKATGTITKKDRLADPRGESEAIQDAVEAAADDIYIKREGKRLDAARAGTTDFPEIGREELDSLPDPDPMIDGILDWGTVTLLSGPSGKGKSFIALDWGLSVASGLPWFGHESIQGSILYVAAEGAHGQKKRIKAWEQAHKTDARFRMITVPVNLSNEAHVDELVKRVRDGERDLVIIDTLAKCTAGVEENSAKEMGVVLAALYRIRDAIEENGTTVLVVHHTGYDTKRARGSSAIAAGVDNVYDIFAEDPHMDIKLTCSKRKDGEPPAPIFMHLEQVALEDDGGTSCVVVKDEAPDGDEATNKVDKDASILQAIRAGGEEWVSTTSLVGTTGISATELRRRLADLLSQGKIVQLPGHGNVPDKWKIQAL